MAKIALRRSCICLPECKCTRVSSSNQHGMQSEVTAKAITTSAAVATRVPQLPLLFPPSLVFTAIYIRELILFITAGMYLRVLLLVRSLAGPLAVNTPGVY